MARADFRSRRAWCALALLVLLGHGRVALGEPRSAVALGPGTIRHVTMPAGAVGWIGTFDVEPSARALSVAIHSTEDLNLFLRRGRPFAGDFDAEATVRRAAGAPMESVRVTGPLTSGRWYVAVVRAGSKDSATPFEILAFVDRPDDGHTLLPQTVEQVQALRSPAGVSARTWFPEGAQALTFSFAGGKPPAGTTARLIGPTGMTQRQWTGPLTLRRSEFPAGMYQLQFDPIEANRFDKAMRLRVALGEPDVVAPPQPRTPSIAPTLTLGSSLTIRLGGTGSATAWKFRINVPEGTRALVIEASADNDADVDLFLNRGNEAPEDEESAAYFAMSTSSVEQLFVGGERVLPPGPYTGTALLVDADKSVSIRLRARRVTEKSRRRTWGRDAPSVLKPGEWVRGSLEADERPVAWYFVTVPKDTKMFRAFVAQATAPVELVLVRRTDGSVMRRSMTPRVDERMDVSFATPPSTPRFFVLGVFARDPYDKHVEFRLATSIDAPIRPPSDLRFPPFLDPTNASTAERAAAAIVELTIRGNTGGSGTCVTPHGHILTCRHVLQREGDADIQRKGILVAFSPRVDRPPVQSFIARVVEDSAAWDLALLVVTEDIFGRPVDPKAPFPWLLLGADATLHLGDPVSVLGFPADGSDRSRTPVIFSTGVISGLESKANALRWIKTDAWIASGHSGGALIDAQGRVVGVPAATLGDLEDLGLAVPVSAIPRPWVRRIERAVKR